MLDEDVWLRYNLGSGCRIEKKFRELVLECDIIGDEGDKIEILKLSKED